MISGPQNDLRHTGHIGYDGAIFGDVGFIGDNYDKLPVKVASTGWYLDFAKSYKRYFIMIYFIIHFVICRKNYNIIM